MANKIWQTGDIITAEDLNRIESTINKSIGGFIYDKLYLYYDIYKATPELISKLKENTDASVLVLLRSYSRDDKYDGAIKFEVVNNAVIDTELEDFIPLMFYGRNPPKYLDVDFIKGVSQKFTKSDETGLYTQTYRDSIISSVTWDPKNFVLNVFPNLGNSKELAFSFISMLIPIKYFKNIYNIDNLIIAQADAYIDESSEQYLLGYYGIDQLPSTSDMLTIEGMVVEGRIEELFGEDLTTVLTSKFNFGTNNLTIDVEYQKFYGGNVDIINNKKYTPTGEGVTIQAGNAEPEATYILPYLNLESILFDIGYTTDTNRDDQRRIVLVDGVQGIDCRAYLGERWSEYLAKCESTVKLIYGFYNSSDNSIIVSLGKATIMEQGVGSNNYNITCSYTDQLETDKSISLNFTLASSRFVVNNVTNTTGYELRIYGAIRTATIDTIYSEVKYDINKSNIDYYNPYYSIVYNYQNQSNVYSHIDLPNIGNYLKHDTSIFGFLIRNRIIDRLSYITDGSNEEILYPEGNVVEYEKLPNLKVRIKEHPEY